MLMGTFKIVQQLQQTSLLFIKGGGGDINDNKFLLNIIVDVKLVLFSLTHAVQVNFDMVRKSLNFSVHVCVTNIHHILRMWCKICR